MDPRSGTLRELSLKQCVDIWGWNQKGVDEASLSPEEDAATISKIVIPPIPPKFKAFLSRRVNIYREIANMSKLGKHSNILQLLEVLEFVQDTKSTIFLVRVVCVPGGSITYVRH